MTNPAIVWPLLIALTTLAGIQRPRVRDHRETPGAAAQWTVDRAEVDSVQFHRLFNQGAGRHLSSGSSGRLVWGTVSPGAAGVMFENCTRPGEVIFSSDRVAIRFGQKFLIQARGDTGLSWTDDREAGCEFRLIPGQRGFAPVGSRREAFAVYNIANNRYLVYKRPPLNVPVLGLLWQATASGRPPADIGARADFVAQELVFTEGSVGDRVTQAVHLTIQNVGNVRSSASQREMTIRIRDEETRFPVINPVAPGAMLRSVVRVSRPLKHCESVVVELDTNPTLKFQVGRGASSNADVFANDRKTLVARNLRPPDTSRGRAVARDCEPPKIAR